MSINFVNTLGAFNAYEAQPTDEEIDVDNALEQISGLARVVRSNIIPAYENAIQLLYASIVALRANAF